MCRSASLWAALFALGGCSSRADNESASGAGLSFPDRLPTFAPRGHLLGYVTNEGSDTVSVVDLDEMVLLGSAPVGLDPVDPDGPTSLALDPVADVVYVALSYPLPSAEGPHAAHDPLPRPGHVEALLLDDLSHVGDLTVDASPADLALSEDRGRLVLSHDDVDLAAQNTDDIDARRANLSIVEPAAGLASGAAGLRTVPVCAAPYGLAYGAGDTRIFVACTGEDSLAVVDLRLLAVVARVPANADATGTNKPYALAADPSGDRLAVSNQVSRSVTLFDMSDAPSQRWSSAFDGRTSAVPTGVPYFAVWPSRSTLLVPVQSPDGAARLDAATGAVASAVAYAADQCESPRRARVAGDGRIFLVCEGDHFDNGAVAEIDPGTLAVLRRVEVDVAPSDLALLTP